MIIYLDNLQGFCGVKLTKFWVPMVCLAAALAGNSALWAAGPQSTPASPPAKAAGAPDPSEALKARDLPEAARQARLQAEKGSPEGQFNLSALADFPRAAAARSEMLKASDPSLAKTVMDWARARLVKEAEAGDNRALVLLSNSFAPQFGFENLAESYYWALLAVTSGQVDAKRRRDSLVSTLKPADVIKTQDKAAEWYAKYREGAAKNASTPKG
jgi:hypothetical protein